MLDRVLEFAGALRVAGVPVSVGEDVDALRAVEALGLEDRDAVRSAFAAALVKSQSHRPAFDVLFDLYFGTGAEAGEGSEGKDLSPDEAAADLAEAVAAGDDEALRELARRSVAAFGRVEGSQARDWFSQYQVLRALDLRLVLGRLKRETEAGHGLDRMLLHEEFEARVQAFSDAVLAETRRRVAAVRGAEAVASYAVPLPPEEVDFLRASADELDDLRRAVRPLARKLAARIAMKRRRALRGGLDVRRTVRHSLSTGGVPLTPYFRHRVPHRPELFVLCDVSGSMGRFARFALMLVHSLSAQFNRVRSFAFVDTLDEVSGFFEDEDFVAAVERMSQEATVVSSDGHSDYGSSFERFRDAYGRELSPKSTILVLGDARNNYRPRRVEALRSLTEGVRHSYWLNPEPIADWDTGDSAASEYAGAVDRMVEVRNLSQLEDFIARSL